MPKSERMITGNKTTDDELGMIEIIERQTYPIPIHKFSQDLVDLDSFYNKADSWEKNYEKYY